MRNTEKAMYMVYWTVVDNGTKYPHAKEFESRDMGAALKFMEGLREKQRNGEAIHFVTLSSENPQSVGHPGVAETGPDYNWKKRRR
jgi:hypothetical protein